MEDIFAGATRDNETNAQYEPYISLKMKNNANSTMSLI